MKRTIVGVALLLAALTAAPAFGGQRCEQTALAPMELADAASTAMRVVAALEEADAPVALVARVGTDLSSHGLVYSHAGFAVRDHANGRWTVVHLLNTCATDRSDLYAQGMINFFSDDLVNQDARIVWFEPGLADALAAHFADLPTRKLHHPRYNLIARPGSADYQNSTAWIVETLGAALDRPEHRPTRASAYRAAVDHGFAPDVMRIAYTKRIAGGLFGGNVAFTDHSVGTRLSGQYPVATVRSIFHWLQRAGLDSRTIEWRNGREMAEPGPG